MAEVDPIFVKLEQLITSSRLRELAVLLNVDRTDRVLRLAAGLRPLRPGVYLLGTGPSTTGIVPLSVEEIVFGRAAMPTEEPAEAVIDYAVTDTLYFGPWETSRIHAKVVRREGPDGTEYWVVDLGSRCGTFVNDGAVGEQGLRLAHGDVISLGPSLVSTYMFFEKEAETNGAASE